ncbi:MAG: DUF3500 domain-containing protein [Pseudomonadales bacterium]
MKKLTALWLVGLSFNVLAHQAPSVSVEKLIPIPEYSEHHGQASAAAALKAAQMFLASFSEAQRQQFTFLLEARERTEWSNLPAGIVERAGISVGELSAEQRGLLFDFLSASLDRQGYQQVMNIMAAEAFLSTDKRAARLKWAPENYWVSLYGEPSETSPWGWQFGGHHLALNIAIEDNKVETMSPSFIGTEPAIFSYRGVDYESVIDMHRIAYKVYLALESAQRERASVVKVPKDILTGPGKDGVIPKQVGLKGSDMSAAQREALLAAIEQWVSVQPRENAQHRMREIAAQLDATYFAWTGTDEVNTPSYMRIQGPSLIIELLSTGGNVGESASGKGHYHTIYRNPLNEYGLGN